MLGFFCFFFSLNFFYHLVICYFAAAAALAALMFPFFSCERFGGNPYFLCINVLWDQSGHVVGPAGD